MTANADPAAVPFTSADYLARMQRAVASAQAAKLDGVLVTPGPDLVWLTGYRPTAITERLTVLVLTPDREPTLLVPTLERPDAEGATAAPVLLMVDWADGDGRRLGPRRGDDGDLGLRLGDAPARPAGRAAGQLVPVADAEPADAPGGQ